MKEITLADWKATDRHRELVNQVLDDGRLTYGPMHKKFEKWFAELHNRKYAIFTNSGTSALQVSIQYLKDKFGWEDDDEVLIPATTFVATVNVVLQNRLKPVLVDVHPQYYNIDPNMIEDKITDRTVAIMPVHLLGQPADMEKIMEIVEEYDLKVIEDSCETMFVEENGHKVGSRGDIACFSSYLAHIISTGVGGFILTDNEEWADSMRSMIWHGRDNYYLSMDDNSKEDKKRLLNARFKFNKPGHSYRATELEAALGIAELETAANLISKRQANATFLFNELYKLREYFQLPEVNKNTGHAWMFFPIVLAKGWDRDDFCLYLEENGIHTRFLMPLTNQPVYEDLFNEKDYPVSRYLNKYGLLIGCHQYLTEEDLEYIVQTIKAYFAN